MRKFYVHDPDVSRKLLVAKVQDPKDADVVILGVRYDMSARELLDCYKMAAESGTRALFCVRDEYTSEFYESVKFMIRSLSSKLITMPDLLERLEKDIAEYTEYSVDAFVLGTSKEYGIAESDAKLLLPVVERELRGHSVYLITKTLIGMFEAGVSNHTKFVQHMKYFLEVYNGIRNADAVFRETCSQCLSVIAATTFKPRGDLSAFERFTMSVMLAPYKVSETPEGRIDVITRTIREAR